MSRKAINVLSLSFLDLISLGLGAVILLMIIFASIMNGQRQHHRQFIFTTTLEFNLEFNELEATSSGTDPDSLASALLSGRRLKPDDYFEVLLYDPNGQEHHPYLPKSDKGDRPATYTLPRPAYGRWRMHLRLKRDLPPGLAEGSVRHPLIEVPRGLESLDELFKRFCDQRHTPDALLTSILGEVKLLAETAQGMTAEGIQAVLWRTLLYLRAYLTPELTAAEAGRRGRTVNDILFTPRLRLAVPGQTNYLQHALLAACLLETADAIARGGLSSEDDLLRARGLWAESYRSLQEVKRLIYDADTEHPERLDPAKREGLVRRTRENEIVVAHYLRTWERGGWSQRLIRCALANALTLSNGDEPLGVFRSPAGGGPFVHADGKSLWRVLTASGVYDVQPEEPNPADESVIARLVVDSRIQIGFNEPEMLQTTTSRSRMEARLLQILRDLSSIDVAPSVPVLFLVETFAGQGIPPQFKEPVEKLLRQLGQQANLTTEINRLARAVPGMYFAARRAALANTQFGVTLKHMLIHWGSQVASSSKPIVVKTTHLLSPDPIVEFTLSHDRVEIVETK